MTADGPARAAPPWPWLLDLGRLLAATSRRLWPLEPLPLEDSYE